MKGPGLTEYAMFFVSAGAGGGFSAGYFTYGFAFGVLTGAMGTASGYLLSVYCLHRNQQSQASAEPDLEKQDTPTAPLLKS